MIVRDKDVLSSLSRVAKCTVCMSVPTVDEDAWRILEPGTAHPLQRLRAVRELADAGIHAGVLMAPIVPGFSSSRSKLERTIKSIASILHTSPAAIDFSMKRFMPFSDASRPSACQPSISWS